MAGEDILLRVRLDTSGARDQLRGLIPGTSTQGVPSGGGAAAVAGGGGGGGAPAAGAARFSGAANASGGFLGGISLSAAALMAGATAAFAASPGSGSMLSGGFDWARGSFFGGGAMGDAARPAAAQQAVMQAFGGAVGVGALSANDPIIKRMMEIESRYGAGAEAAGQAEIKAATGGDVAKAGLKAFVDGWKHAFTEAIPEMTKAVADGVRQGFQG